MNFKVGDFVKGNELHCNPERMKDTSIVVEVLEKEFGYWICWFNDKQKHFAEDDELELVEQVWI